MAGITVRIDNRYSYLESLCRDFTVPAVADVDMSICGSEEEIDGEIARSGQSNRGYTESVCACRRICSELPCRFDGFLFHSALIEYEGKGYAFAAPSGTGKSTHIRMWQERFGDGVRVVNGDKPIFRLIDGKFYAYGTPWCGKEGQHINTSVPLEAVCFLERSENNFIEKIDVSRAVMKVMKQIIVPTDARTLDSLFSLIEKMLLGVSTYRLGCNISQEAAEVAYNGINNI